jgi:hypothetical protein
MKEKGRRVRPGKGAGWNQAPGDRSTTSGFTEREVRPRPARYSPAALPNPPAAGAKLPRRDSRRTPPPKRRLLPFRAPKDGSFLPVPDFLAGT